MDNEERIEQGANCRHIRNPFVVGVSERTYTDQQLEHIDDGLGCTYDGVDYTAYQATQMQRRIERSIRKQTRLRNAYEAAGLPEQPERMKVLYTAELTDHKMFAPLKGYGEPWKIMGKFSERQSIIDAGKPRILGARQHFWDNIENKIDRMGLTIEAAQSIIDHSKLTLYQPDKAVLKFIADTGYTIINTKKSCYNCARKDAKKVSRLFGRKMTWQEVR